MRVLLASPYEIGRQPLALAHPAAILRQAGHHVHCVDLSLGTLPWDDLAEFDIIALSVVMHTATRIAARLLPRIREKAPRAHLVCYGLYGPAHASILTGLGANTVLGPDCEGSLLDLADGREDKPPANAPARVRFVVPDRRGLPDLGRYAHLIGPDGGKKTVAFAETTRGCKHLCRHCPVVPIYRGRFRALPRDVVLDDISQQIEQGATHVSFGDPDFLNGPAQALRITEALHERWPHVTFDATIKVSHICEHPEIIRTLAKRGCVMITSAVESFEDAVLANLDKGHTAADIYTASAIVRAAGVSLMPTFVPFTPWTTLDGYRQLLQSIQDLDWVDAVAPIQLAIRLLVPAGSYLLDLPGFRDELGPFAAERFGFPWAHRDTRVDALQEAVQQRVEVAEERKEGRRETFGALWDLAHAACNLPAPVLVQSAGVTAVFRLSEPWYCCAEPTTTQLAVADAST
ncbi:MAG: CUAEP/CCAEP-tail radical SAM protein [Gammaproteobacteria bacterium]|nr:CUAEP/CCAEP-tail radical SAM protein [Gammaproteobacteria bacterium]